MEKVSKILKDMKYILEYYSNPYTVIHLNSGGLYDKYEFRKYIRNIGTIQQEIIIKPGVNSFICSGAPTSLWKTSLLYSFKDVFRLLIEREINK